MLSRGDLGVLAGCVVLTTAAVVCLLAVTGLHIFYRTIERANLMPIIEVW